MRGCDDFFRIFGEVEAKGGERVVTDIRFESISERRMLNMTASVSPCRIEQNDDLQICD